MKDKRSLIHFGILVVIALLVTLFVIGKANEAIAEMDALNTPIYLQR